jgi:glycosyltransferase involved in cell wall biosynthesis
MPPQISVVLPVYNAEKFLAKAVESLLQQTYSNFELIIIDDGSSDSSPDILRHYAEVDQRVKVYRQPSNMGLIAALNRGCELAQGRYIARMDADDISTPQRLEKQLTYLDANPDVGVVGAALQYIDASENKGRIASVPLLAGHLRWRMLFGNYLPHPLAMIRRDTLAKVGLYRPEAYRIEDYDLWTRILEFAELANLPDVLLYYREHSQSSMVSSKPPVERRATEIVQANLERLLKTPIQFEEAARLRAIDNPVDGVKPLTVVTQQKTAILLRALYEAYFQTMQLTADEIQSIKQDLARKFFILARLSLAVSPIQSVKWIGEALYLSPYSIMTAGTALARKTSQKVQLIVSRNQNNSSPH